MYGGAHICHHMVFTFYKWPEVGNVGGMIYHQTDQSKTSSNHKQRPIKENLRFRKYFLKDLRFPVFRRQRNVYNIFLRTSKVLNFELHEITNETNKSKNTTRSGVNDELV